MKTTKNEVVNDLKMLIDISCLQTKDARIFELFHIMIIRISYKAVDISIDYDRQRIYMNVISEDNFNDLESKNHSFGPVMLVNMVYKELSTFLKSCILEDMDSLNYYYPTLLSKFSNRNFKKNKKRLSRV